jgi:uncharacterized protein involved in type VI secretion and phage assembly
MKQFIGKFRGTVANNVDPQRRGRIQVRVPPVLGESTLSWAMPCVPYAGPGVGFFAIPPVGANVWVEFEDGDPDYPVWAGCFWDEGDAPADPAVAEMKVFKTDVGTITLNDTPGAGGITIETTAGAKIVMNSTGIEINDGQGGSIKLAGPQVSINNGALEVS